MALSGAFQQLTEWFGARVGPEATGVLRRVRRSAGDFEARVLGDDFESRMRQIRERYASRGGDPFGLDLDATEQAVKVCALFHRVYFRTVVKGMDHLPRGRVLLVGNHSGQVPIDAAIVAAACFLDANPPRVVRAMVEKWTSRVPFVSAFFPRVGQVLGVPENCRRLLEMGEAILTFPEGVRGVSKPFSQRYRLQQFGQGFMRLAMSTETPVLPFALVGAEEQYISLGRLDWAAELLGVPVFPLVPQILLPGGQLPLPTKYRLELGQAMEFDGDSEDDQLVAGRVDLVQRTIGSMLERGLRERQGIFF